MAVTAESFRDIFPEFIDSTKFRETAVVFWLGVAESAVPDWGERRDLGVALFVAHQIALQTQNVGSAAGGAIPGLSSGGVVSSKTLDKVSLSYDTAAATNQGAGHWNLTTYGTRYYQLAQAFGTAVVYIG